MSDKVKVALLGCGGIMHKHAGAAKQMQTVDVVGLCDVNEPGMDAINERHFADAPRPKFSEPGDMYAATKPDAVVIATPHTLHYRHACEALDAGCHILMEKPMVTELADAYDLEKRVADAGKVFCVAYNTPCSAEFYTLREMIRHDELGKLKVISIYLSQQWYLATKGSWRQDPGLSGGGQLYDSGAHVLNSLCWTVEADVEEVYAHIDRLDSPVDINGTMTVKFANGVLAAVAISGEGANGSHGTWVFEKGRVDLDPWGAGRMEIVTHPKFCDWTTSQARYPRMRGEDGHPFGNFIGAIRGTEEQRTTPRNGVIQSQLMDAAYRSAETGQPARPRVAAPA